MPKHKKTVVYNKTICKIMDVRETGLRLTASVDFSSLKIGV